MTLKDIDTQFTKAADVAEFSRQVEQYIRNDKRQVLQVCRATGEFRLSAVDADNCEGPWLKLD